MSDYIKGSVYESTLNGRVPNDGMKINGIEKITYYNPLAKKNQTQSYLDMDDIIVTLILRKNKEGKYQFAMEYKYVPAAERTMLELPVISTMQNTASYDGETIEDLLETGLIDNYGIDMIGYRKIDGTATPVSQSFTNQKATAVLAYTRQEESENNNLEWFDISSLKWEKTTDGKTIVYGRSINDYDMIRFKVNKNNTCNYTELINFFRKLDRLDILDNYVYAVEEAFRKDYIIDEKLENIKLLIK